MAITPEVAAHVEGIYRRCLAPAVDDTNWKTCRAFERDMFKAALRDAYAELQNEKDRVAGSLA